MRGKLVLPCGDEVQRDDEGRWGDEERGGRSGFPVQLRIGGQRSSGCFTDDDEQIQSPYCADSRNT